MTVKERFQKLTAGKTFYLVLSIVLAIVAWLAVMSVTNPVVTRTMEVPIEFLNENAPATLDLKDMTVTYPKTVTVTVSGRKDTVNNLNISEVTASCDLDAITKAGETVIKVTKQVCEPAWRRCRITAIMYRWISATASRKVRWIRTAAPRSW